MEIVKRVLNNYKFIWIAVLLIPASWALFIPGYFGASDDIHIAWLFEFHKTLIMGQIPPRFVPDLSFNFGYPLFNFVFPFPFYVAEIFHLIGFSLVDSIKALFFLTIPLSFLFMYLLLRQLSSKLISLAGAIFYVYTPYRAVDLYIRGAIGEVVSFMLLPAVLLSIIKLNNSKVRWIGIGAISLASLVLSHNITAYMFLPFVILFFIFQYFLSKDKKTFLVKSILMVFLGLLLSIYFWLPAAIESGLMKYDTVFSFADHFPTISQLFTPYWGYGGSVPGTGDGMSFFLGITNILLLILGIILTVLYWSKINKQLKLFIIWSFICISIALFLMNYRSTFLWISLPLLPYFQFPWRFLMLTTLATPLLVVLLEQLKYKKTIIFTLIVLTLITSGSFFRPQDFLGRSDDYFLNRYIPTPVASKEYLETQEEYLRLPKNTDIRPSQNYPLATIKNGEIEMIKRLNELDSLIEIYSEEGSVLDYNKYFFPGWVSLIDNKESQIVPGKPFGQISVNIPSGSHKVVIAFRETNLRMLLNAISLVSFLVSLWMCLTRKSLNRIGTFS